MYKTQIRSLDSPVENSFHFTLNKLTLTMIIQDGLAPFLSLAQLFPQLQSEETCSSLVLSHRTFDRQHFPTLQVLFNCHLLPCLVISSSHTPPLTWSDLITFPQIVASFLLSLSDLSYLFIGLQPVIHFQNKSSMKTETCPFHVSLYFSAHRSMRYRADPQ